MILAKNKRKGVGALPARTGKRAPKSRNGKVPAGSPKVKSIPAIPSDVRLTTLENGLTIIIREDHSAPVVSAQAWSMTGSIHEGKWLGGGMSHVLEHMLFKGTTTRPG